jgi:MFS family permease
VSGEASTTARLPRTVLALAATSFFTDVGSELVFSLMPLFLPAIGAGPAFLGALEGVADATAALLKYLSGGWADRRRTKRPLVLLGYTLSSATRPVLTLVTLPWHVFALRVVDRVGKGVRTSPRDALLAQAVEPAQAARAFGFHQAMDHAGAVMGPLLGAALLAFGLDLRTIFLVTLVPGLLSIASVLLIREAPVEVAAPGAASEPLGAPVKGLIACITVFSLGAATDGFILLRAAALGTTTALVPVLWTLLHVSKMVWASLGGRWGDRVDRGRLLTAAWLIFVVVMVGFAAATEAWHVWAVAAVAGAWQGLAEPVQKALVASLAPARAKGRTFGVLNGLKGAAAIPAGLGFGLLWERVSAATAFSASAGVGVVAVLLLGRWRARQQG